jgi:hypothetical protein
MAMNVTLVLDEILRRVYEGDPRAAVILYRRVMSAVNAAMGTPEGVRQDDHERVAHRTADRVIATLVSGEYAGQCSLTAWAASLSEGVATEAPRVS